MNRNRFAEATTIHGLRDVIHASSNQTRILWTLVLLCSMGILGYNIVKTGLAFYDAPVITSVRWKHVGDFPPIAYCPNGIVAANLERLNLSAEHMLFLNDYFVMTRTIGT